jgi:hypothetical protein
MATVSYRAGGGRPGRAPRLPTLPPVVMDSGPFCTKRRLQD